MTNAAVFAREVRVLEGPNLYFTRPAVKVVLAVPGLVGMPDADFAALWDRAGARGGGGRALAPAGSAGRQRMVLRLIESMTRRLVRAVGVTRVGLRVRAGSGVDEVVVALPVAHIMGFATLVGLATAALPVYFMRRFRPNDVLNAIESRRCSGFVGVPAMYRMMLEAGADRHDLKSVRVWMSGADVMPSELARSFKKFGASLHVPLVGDLGEALFVEGYGMVEVGGGVAAKVSPPYLPLGVGETVGFRLPGYKFRVVDESDAEVSMGGLGELWVRGPGVLTGYWNAPAATEAAVTEDGWLRTGDLVRVGPLGTVMFCGRRKHTVKSGGYSVYPLEVETLLEEHPDVVEASVVGIPDAKLGEVPAAAVRVRRRAKVDGDEIAAWAAERLAAYKAPRRVIVVDELPRTGTEKVQKERLVELFT